MTLQHALFAALHPAGSMQLDERLEQPLEARGRHTLDPDGQSVTLCPPTQVLDLFHHGLGYGLVQPAHEWTEREDRSHTVWRRFSGTPGQRRRFEKHAVGAQVLELAHIPAVAVLGQVRPQRVDDGRPLISVDQDTLIVGDAGAHKRQDTLGAARVHHQGRRADQASAAPEQDKPWLADSERSAPRNQPIRMLEDARSGSSAPQLGPLRADAGQASQRGHRLDAEVLAAPSGATGGNHALVACQIPSGHGVCRKPVYRDTPSFDWIDGVGAQDRIRHLFGAIDEEPGPPVLDNFGQGAGTKRDNGRAARQGFHSHE